MNQPTLNYNQARRLRAMFWPTRLFIAALSITLLILLCNVLGSAMLAHVFYGYGTKTGWDPREARLADNAYWIVYWSLLAAMIATGAVLISWMFWAQRTIRKNGRRLRSAPIMFVFGWVLPYWCFIRPYELLREIYVASRNTPLRRFRPLIGSWWALWLLANLLNLLIHFASKAPNMTAEEYVVTRFALDAIDAAIYLTAGILLMLIVIRIDQGIRALADA